MGGASIDNNPTPGNKPGGLTTIYEKSLGAIAKAGHDAAEPGASATPSASRERGFVHMDTPGYDPVSVTGQVAGGCNFVVFTTGRGSAFGYKPAPSLKIATNCELSTPTRSRTWTSTPAGCSTASPSTSSVQEIFEEILAVASGKQTKSELAGVGDEEFNPWILGATL